MIHHTHIHIHDDDEFESKHPRGHGGLFGMGSGSAKAPKAVAQKKEKAPKAQKKPPLAEQLNSLEFEERTLARRDVLAKENKAPPEHLEFLSKLRGEIAAKRSALESKLAKQKPKAEKAQAKPKAEKPAKAPKPEKPMTKAEKLKELDFSERTLARREVLAKEGGATQEHNDFLKKLRTDLEAEKAALSAPKPKKPKAKKTAASEAKPKTGGHAVNSLEAIRESINRVFPENQKQTPNPWVQRGQERAETEPQRAIGLRDPGAEATFAEFAKAASAPSGRKESAGSESEPKAKKPKAEKAKEPKIKKSGGIRKGILSNSKY